MRGLLQDFYLIALAVALETKLYYSAEAGTHRALLSSSQGNAVQVIGEAHRVFPLYL